MEIPKCIILQWRRVIHDSLYRIPIPFRNLICLVEYAVGFKFKTSLAKILYNIHNKLEPVAWFVLTIVFLITTYYICIVGWDLIYLALSFTKAWGSNPDLFFTQSVLHSTDSIRGIFTIVPTILVSIIIIWSVVWAIIRTNLNDGIGKVSRILLPYSV